MPAVVDIVNRALISLGAAPIISIDQEGKTATTAKMLYPQVRDHVLRSHPWNCCSRRADLTPLITTPPFEWGYAFSLPADCLRVLEVNGTSWPTEGWVVEARQLLTNDALVELLYIRREEDTNLYDAELVTALAAHLAYELAPTITALPSVISAAGERAHDSLMEARRSDGLEEDLVENPNEAGWVMARFE